MGIKPAWIITDMNLKPFEKDGVVVEYKSERAAREGVVEALALKPSDEEAWIWKLSHVASRPVMKPDIEAVK